MVKNVVGSPHPSILNQPVRYKAEVFGYSQVACMTNQPCIRPKHTASTPIQLIILTKLRLSEAVVRQEWEEILIKGWHPPHEGAR